MGMIAFETYMACLIDDEGFISFSSGQRFVIVDDAVPSYWYFRLIGKDEDIYPSIQAIWGYEELGPDKKSSEKLSAEKDEATRRLYSRRKIARAKGLSA